jgi:hypothetical protein
MCDYYAYAEFNLKGIEYVFGMLFIALFRLRIRVDFYHASVDLWCFERMRSLYMRLAAWRWRRGNVKVPV